MKRNPVKEAFKTREGLICFIAATIGIIAYVVLINVLPSDYSGRMTILSILTVVIIGAGVIFSQITGAIQNDIDKEENEQARQLKHPGKKK